MTQDEIRVFDWDDEIQDDGEERNFVTLDEGDYDFEVIKFERGNYIPGPKSSLPQCNMAIITIKVSTNAGDAYITEKFQLCSKVEWKISSFFRSIGLKQHGEKLRMRWQEAIGCKGRAHITKTEGTQKPGIFFNNVGYFIDPSVEEGGDDTWN